MKKQLQIEAVANGFLAREPSQPGFAFNPEQSFVFSDASALGAWVAEYFAGPAPVFAEPEPTQVPSAPAPSAASGVLDLRTCVKGQKLRLRDGNVATYEECFKPDATDAQDAHRYLHPEHGLLSCSHDGCWMLGGDGEDVVEILPLEAEAAQAPVLPEPAALKKKKAAKKPRPVTEAQVRALRPGDVVVLNTGERSTVIENDASGVPVKTNRDTEYDETRWFHSDGRLRCAREDDPDAPRIVKIEKKK